MTMAEWLDEEEYTIQSIESLEELSTNAIEACSCCALPNCNGLRHQCDVEFLYPTCADCGIELLDLNELIDGASPSNTDSCEVCQLPYDSDALARQHLLNHFSMNANNLKIQFVCIECSTDEEQINDQVEHIDEQLIGNDEYEEKFIAYIEAEKVEVVLQDHLQLEDDSKPPIKRRPRRKLCVTEGNPTAKQRRFLQKVVDHFECSACAEIFDTKPELNMHRREWHSVNVAKSDPADITEYKCRVCNVVFDAKKQRRDHEIEQHRNADSLLYDCPECSAQRTTASALYNHMHSHSNTKPFVCNTCGKSFRRINNLEEHCKTHASDRIHKCQHCPKSFKTIALRNRHIRQAHCDARPYVCELCPKRYKEFSDMRRHRWTHGGYEKRFACSQCDKTFFENKTLRNHLKVHDKHKISIVTQELKVFKTE